LQNSAQESIKMKKKQQEQQSSKMHALTSEISEITFSKSAIQSLENNINEETAIVNEMNQKSTLDESNKQIDIIMQQKKKEIELKTHNLSEELKTLSTQSTNKTKLNIKANEKSKKEEIYKKIV